MVDWIVALWELFEEWLPDTQPQRAEVTAAVAAALLIFICICGCICRMTCPRYFCGRPFYCCCCLCTECFHCCMCCKNTRYKDAKRGERGKPEDEAITKEQFARLDKKKKEREVAEKKRLHIKEQKLRRQERAEWFASLNPFRSRRAEGRAYQRGGEELLAGADDVEAGGVGSVGALPLAADDDLEAEQRPGGKARDRTADPRPFDVRMAEARRKAQRIRAARRVQRKWRLHVLQSKLHRGLEAGAKQRKKTRGGKMLDKRLDLGTEYLAYSNPADGSGEPKKASLGQRLRGKQPTTRLQLSLVAAVERMDEPLAWSVLMRDGTRYEFRAETEQARNAWVQGVEERMRALVRRRMDAAITKATGGRY